MVVTRGLVARFAPVILSVVLLIQQTALAFPLAGSGSVGTTHSSGTITHHALMHHIAGVSPTNSGSSGASVISGAALTKILGNAVTSTQGNLVIDVSALAQPGHLTLSSNFTNVGHLILVSTNPSITTAYFTAPSLYNAPGAVISTAAPNSSVGLASVIPGLNLVITTYHNLWNAGSLISSANLTANAGGQFINAGSITASQNLNVLAAVDVSHAGSRWVSFCEFSVAQALASNRILHSLRRSRADSDVKVVNEIIRTAACLSVITAGHGPFNGR